MMNLLNEAGFPVIFLLSFGLLAMVFAVRFAIAPSQRAFRMTLVLGAATLMTAINGMLAAFAAVGHHAPDYVKAHAGSSLPEIVLLGFAESMAPGILGFTLLSLVALIVALGVWRQNPS